MAFRVFDSSDEGATFVLIILTLPICVLLTALRVLLGLRSGRTFNTEDWLAFAAVWPFVAWCVCGLVLGGDPQAGRKLVSWALEVGVKRDQMEMSYGNWLTTEESTKDTFARGILKVLTGPTRSNALKFGLTEEEIDMICRDTLASTGKEDKMWLMLQTEIIICK